MNEQDGPSPVGYVVRFSWDRRVRGEGGRYKLLHIKREGFYIHADGRERLGSYEGFCDIDIPYPDENDPRIRVLEQRADRLVALLNAAYQLDYHDPIFWAQLKTDVDHVREQARELRVEAQP